MTAVRNLAGRKPSPKQPGANKELAFPSSPAFALSVLSEEGKESGGGGAPPGTLYSQTPIPSHGGWGKSHRFSLHRKSLLFSVPVFTRCV